MLCSGQSHEDVRLSRTDLLEITNWLDVNCQFHPSYWGRLNAKYQEHPNYRPNVAFAEAILRTVPDSLARAEDAVKKLPSVSLRTAQKPTNAD